MTSVLHSTGAEPDWLHLLNGKPALAVLLRHAEREPLPAGSPGDDVPLTPRGALQAQQLGLRLSARLVGVESSPIGRCIETARSIAACADPSIEVSEIRLLGDPGAFVLDGKLAWQNWVELGHEAVMRHLADEDDPLPGMAPPRAAARRLLEHMLGRARVRPGVWVFVTHDSLISGMAARLMGVVPSPDTFPGFLEAACFWEEGGHAYGAYRRWDRQIAEGPEG